MIQRIRASLIRERLGQRLMTGSAIFLSILALIIGIGGYITFQSFLRDRDERTITSCKSIAKTAINDNENLEQQVDGLYFIESLVVDPVDHPEEAKFLNGQIDVQVSSIRENYQQVRDCSSDGISEYNKTKGKLGYLDGPQVVQAKRRTPVEGA